MTVSVTVEMMRDGPEDTVVTSKLESINVGEDEAGKVLTSLVVVPSEAPIHTDHKWSRGLAVFRKALLVALAAAGELINEGDASYAPQVRAVDLEHVRTEFYRSYLAKGDDDRQRQKNRRQQFSRCIDGAQKEGLIRALVRGSGQTMVWLAGGTT